MAKAALRLVSPNTENRTVGPRRPKNAELRTREHLTADEAELLIEAAKKNRYGQRDGLMVLLAYRHGLRAAEVVDLSPTMRCSLTGGTLRRDVPLGFEVYVTAAARLSPAACGRVSARPKFFAHGSRRVAHLSDELAKLARRYAQMLAPVFNFVGVIDRDLAAVGMGLR